MKRFVLLVALAAPHSGGGDGWSACTTCATLVVPPVASGLSAYADERQIHDNAIAEEKRRMTHPLALGDVIEEDATGHVAAIRHPTSPPTWTRFKPGAESPPNANFVWGETTK